MSSLSGGAGALGALEVDSENCVGGITAITGININCASDLKTHLLVELVTRADLIGEQIGVAGADAP
jgi:hypothetical protein